VHNIGKKRRAEHVTGKFWCRQKKTTTEHVPAKLCAIGKKELQNTWLENFGAIGKKRRAEHVT